jgi:hypothetical protein
MLKQKWHDFKGEWRLVDEQRAEGDIGLIGEPLPSEPTRAPSQKPAQFPTIRLGQQQDAPAPEPSPAPAEGAASTGPATN